MKNIVTLFAATTLITRLMTLPAFSQTYTFTTIAGGSQGDTDGINSAAQFSSPSGVAVDGAGNIYVADELNNAIRQVMPQGTNWVVTTIAGGARGATDGSNLHAEFFGPTGIAGDSEGNLYVSDQFNNTIRKLSPSGTNWVVSTLAGEAGMAGTNDGIGASARFTNPTGVAVDAAGNLFVADEFNNAIRELTKSGDSWRVTTIAGGTAGPADGTGRAAQFFGPSGVAVDGNGNVYVADQFNNAIRLLTLVGGNWVVTTIAGNPIAGRADGTGTNAGFSSPVGIAADSSGNLYVGDEFNNAVRKLTLVAGNWNVATIGGGARGLVDGSGTNAEFFLPFGVAVDSFGSVYVADSGNDAIRIGVSSAAPPATGILEVTLTPAGAVSAGAEWQLDGGGLETNGATLSGLTPGEHTVTFNAVAGFTTPAVQVVTVTAHQTNSVSGLYARAIANAGSLQVEIAPPEAINAGARWQVDGGAFEISGAIVAGLSVSDHNVSFRSIAGWTSPSDQTISITNGETTSAVGTYVLQTGALQVTILPAGVVTAGAKWQVDGGPAQGSGTTLSNILPGVHTLSFNTVLGWTTPSNQTVTVTNGETTPATVIYTQTTAGSGSLQVAILPSDAATAGAQWEIDGGAPQTNGATLADVPAGTHDLSFVSVAGWAAPPDQVVMITNGEETSATGTFVPQAVLTGSLEVTLLPAGAAGAGAQWRVDGGALQAGGATVAGVTTGSHTVSFEAAPGWVPPGNQIVTINVGATTSISGIYHGGSDRTKPVVRITSGPGANAPLTHPDVVIQGKASDNVAVSQVLYQLNNSGYQAIPGTTDWTVNLTLVPGKNVFDVKATDTSGNTSVVVSRTFFYIVTSPLTVTVTGNGTVAPALSGRILDVGNPYMLTARPKPGNLFSSWSGAVSSSNPVLHFMMQSNMAVQANFIANPFLPQSGVFNGLFYDTNGVAQESSGFFEATLMSSGGYSAVIMTEGGPYRFGGTFNLNGESQVTVPRRHSTPLGLDLQLDFAGHLSGVISNATVWAAVLSADHATDAAGAANFRGQYTMAMAGNPTNGATSPAGNGYAMLSISPAGMINMTGALGDGSPIGQVVSIGVNGQWPLYVSANKGAETALGWITFSNQPASTLGGTVSWIRAAGPAPKLYMAGFTNMTAVIGSSYSLAGGAPPLVLNNGEVTLNDVPPSFTLNNSVFLNNRNVLEVTPGPESLALTLKPNGLILGSFHLPGTAAVTAIKGVVLQQQNQAEGFFLTPTESGQFLLQEN